jgi:putative transposase
MAFHIHATPIRPAQAKVEVKQKKRFRLTTDSKHNYPVAPNLLDRQFDIEVPNNTVWGVDITYLWTDEGWLYLAVVIDLFSRRVAGWSLSSRMKVDLVRDALLMAIWRRKPDHGLIHHSDRGNQYACYALAGYPARAWQDPEHVP